MKLTQNLVKYLFLLFIVLIPFFIKAQAPNPALVGYFHNWQDAGAPYIQLDQIDSRYNIIDIAFAVPKSGTDYQIEFIPDQVTQATFISQIQTLHNQSRKVLISIGGATAPVSLDNIVERDTFVNSVARIMNTYSFDGLDIDFEGSSLSTSGGTIASPTDQPVINLIYAIKQIMSNFYTKNHHKLILTMAPETAFVQGGQSAYGGIWGAYLPVIHALRDSLEILHVQLYNSGSMYGVDGGVYTQGTADFIIAMCEAVIQGFNTSGGVFAGLPASKVAVGLPACSSAAGGGFTDTATVRAAINYLRGTGPKPGSYTLVNTGGYPSFRGMMTWSINWDATSNCATVYQFAANYQNIFGVPTSIESEDSSENIFSVYPNPSGDNMSIDIPGHSGSPLNIRIFNMLGEIIFSEIMVSDNETIDISGFPKGIYFLYVDKYKKKIFKN
jgi:chitinase